MNACSPGSARSSSVSVSHRVNQNQTELFRTRCRGRWRYNYDNGTLKQTWISATDLFLTGRSLRDPQGRRNCHQVTTDFKAVQHKDALHNRTIKPLTRDSSSNLWGRAMASVSQLHLAMMLRSAVRPRRTGHRWRIGPVWCSLANANKGCDWSYSWRRESVRKIALWPPNTQPLLKSRCPVIASPFHHLHNGRWTGWQSGRVLPRQVSIQELQLHCDDYGSLCVM